MAAPVAAEPSCTTCHEPRTAKGVDCVGCHEKTQDRPLYGEAKALTFGGDVPRYTEAGLRRYLQNPVPRHGAKRVSMAPVAPDVIDRLVGELKQTGRLGSAGAQTADAKRGEALYGAQCASCHESAGAPRLRVGYPLLSSAYVKRRIREGGDGMPSLPLTDDEMDAVVAYLGEPVAPAKPESTRGAVAFGNRLYRRVMDEALASSCRHCHVQAGSAAEEMKAAFGVAPRAYFLEKQGQDLRLAPSARDLLQAGPRCEDAPIVERLVERRREWDGHAPTPAAGMPLTLPPLSEDLIDDVRRWSRVGCPTHDGPLCRPCDPKGT